MILYHATFKSRIPQIIKYGLDSKHAKNWKDCERGYIYFATNYDIAYDFCETAEDVSDEDYDSGIVVLAVDSNQLKREKFTADPNILDNEDCGCFAYKGTVSAQKLKVVHENYVNRNCVYTYTPLK